MIDPFAQRLLDFLDELGVRHSELRYRGGTDNKIFDLHQSVEIDGELFYWELSGYLPAKLLAVWTYPLLQVPEDKLAVMAEYVARANFACWHGYLEMEYTPGGRVGFSTSICCDGIEPGFAALRHWLHTSFWRTWEHAPFIRRVIAGELTPAEAIEASTEAARTTH
ncbi:MAG TPA: hypothetical protein VGL38_05955 [bacterium]|jgi:hypothetical protein